MSGDGGHRTEGDGGHRDVLGDGGGHRDTAQTEVGESDVEAPTAVTVDDVIDGIGFGRWVVPILLPWSPFHRAYIQFFFPGQVARAIGERLTRVHAAGIKRGCCACAAWAGQRTF